MCKATQITIFKYNNHLNKPMVNLSKRARELMNTYGTVGNIKRLTKELRALQKAERDMKIASANITKILKKKK